MSVGDISLLPGEKLFWSGSPKRGRFFRREDLLVSPILAFWLLGASAALFGHTPPGKPPQQMPIFFTIFALGFCFFAFGLPLCRYRKLAGTTYLVTDRRVVARSSAMGGTERSEYLGELAPPVVRPAEDGTGIITFGHLSLGGLLLAGHNLRPWNRPTPPPMVLLDIEDPERVRELIATGVEVARGNTA